MDTKKIEKFLNDFGLHLLLVLAGLILLVNPSGAAALVTKLLAWVLVIIGAVMLIRPAMQKLYISAGTWIRCGLMIAVGVLLLTRPMLLADSIGRFFGILLLIEGIRNLRTGGTRLLTILTLVAGVVLVVVPRTLTQTLLGICGLVMVVIGAVNILGRLKETKRLEESRDPNIIDADM